MLRNLIFSAFYFFFTPLLWANESIVFSSDETISANSLLNTCTISISNVQGSLNGQTVEYQETIEPIVISFATDCNETLVLNFAPGQLPAGINYTFANNQLIIGGTIEDETPQEYTWTAEVNNSIPADETNSAVSATTSISLSGSITVTPTVVSDFEGPVMSNFSISPASIDLSNGAVTVSATVRITDQTGVATPSSNFGGAYITGTPRGNIYFSHWVRVSGDQFDGIYECFKSIEPDEISQGVYTIIAETTNINDLNGYNANPPLAVIVRVTNTASSTNTPDQDGDGIEDSIDVCPDTPLGETVDASGCPVNNVSCDFTVVTNPFDQSLDFCLGEAITPFEFKLESNCNSSSLSIDVSGLPNGIDYVTSTTDSFTILTFQGTPTTAGFNSAYINISANNFSSSVGGLIFVDGNCGNNGSGSESCDFTVITNPFDQSLDFCLGEAITPFEFKLESNCNSSSLSIDVSGLPNGIDYVTSTTDSFTILTFQGTPTTAGFNSAYINISANNFSSSVGGLIIIDGNCGDNGSGSESCDFTVITNPFDQSLDFCLGEAITPFEFKLESNCNSSSLSIDVSGLPNGIDYVTSTTDSFTILTFQGTPTTAGFNSAYINISANNFSSSVGGLIIIDGNCGDNGSGSESCDFTVITNPFDQSLDFCLGEAITPFEFKLESNCNSSSLSIDVSGLPNGIDYVTSTTDSFTILTFQGTPTTAGFNSAYINISANNFSSSVGGLIFVDGNCGNNGSGSESCDFTVITNPFDQSLDFCLGEAITPFEFKLESNCNSSSLSIDVSGLPNGIDYVTSTTDSFTILTFQGTPTTAGFNSAYINISANNFSSSVGGLIFVDGNCGNNGSGSESCDFTVITNPFDQSLDFCLGEAITPFEFKLESNCNSSSLSIDVSGLPNGIDYVTSTTDSFTILTFQGTPTTAGVEITNINISANFFSSTFGGLIFVDGNCGNNGSGSESCDFTVITNPFDQSLDFCLGEAITPFEFKLESNCNSSSLSIDVSGLPNGIDYVTSTTDSFTILTFQGTPTTAGVEITNINISANFFSSTFGGLIFVDVCGNIDSENSTETLQIDLDKDGVEDFFDVCPDTPAGYPVDPFGCSDDQKNNDYLGDDDNDGILNFIDACPDTTTDTPVDPLGCSEEQGGMVEFLSDQDNDGIVDAFDDCPDTAEGDTVDEKGCSEAQLNDITDFDQDGIDNEFDQCPGTPPGQQVDENGCSILDQDKDLDGILDIYDACLDTPPGEYVDSVGCSEAQKDYDFDGVPNDIDQCPYSPLGIAVNEKGCSESEEKGKEATKDDDGDGVINIIDRCPDTPAGLQVNLTGCTTEQTQSQVNIDNDLDGINNEFDLCPDTQIGVVVNQFGCPINNLDSDFDKVNDDIDLCPDTPVGEEVNEFGCSLAQKEADFDMDGIVNEKDYCQNTPPYLEVNGNGCSEIQILTDADFDGIPNQLDQCPNTTPLTEVDEYGCSFEQRDDDNDGVINALDRCADTATGEKVDPYGCAEIEVNADDDNDGVLNNIDECPNTSSGATVDNKGCPYLPPVIQAQSFEQTENSRDIETDQIRTFLGKVIYQDPNSPTGSKENISLSISDALDGTLFTLVQDSIFLIGRTDYEENPKHRFIVVATNDKNQTTNREMLLKVLDIPNTYSKSNFNVQVFDVKSETSGAKVNYTRYLNPNIDKGVGKWKIKKKIVGGNDAHLFEVKSMQEIPDEKGKTSDQDQGDFLSFINPPDFETPIDHNRDNIYEVEVVNINTNDGEATQPISVNQTNIIVPENDENTVKFQTVPVNATDDSDGDGVLDILDNSPFVYNPNQEDSDGDGVGDVTDDADHDGVWNPNDICNDTPLNTKVNIEGCPVFYLPTNNFSVSSIEKCVGQSEIVLVTLDTSYNYSVNISGQISQTLPFTSETLTINEVPNGTYNICITVDGVDPSEFERCYSIAVQQPSPLSVYGKVAPTGKSVHYDLSGGDVYTIFHNGISIQTDEQSIDIDLDEGINQIRITTGIECQGIFEEEYFNSAEVFYTPNPFRDQLSVYIGGQDTTITIELYNTQGRLLKTSEHQLSTTQRVIQLDTGDLQPGGYIIKSCGDTTTQSEIIIKR